jgi:hypothetical protein
VTLFILKVRITSLPCLQIIKAGLERACFTTHVRLRTLPDSMKTFGFPKMDATASEKLNKARFLTGLRQGVYIIRWDFNEVFCFMWLTE